MTATADTRTEHREVVVIGGGQAGSASREERGIPISTGRGS